VQVEFPNPDSFNQDIASYLILKAISPAYAVPLSKLCLKGS